MSSQPQFIDRPLTPAERAYKHHYLSRVHRAADQLKTLLDNPPIAVEALDVNYRFLEDLNELILDTASEAKGEKGAQLRLRQLKVYSLEPTQEMAGGF